VPRLDDDEDAAAAPPPDTHDAGDRVRPDARHRSKSLLKIGLEVVLIGTGVFLGLMGEQWRERAQHRALATETLRRFREEIAINRTAVSAVKDYHATMKKTLDAFVSADAKTREKMDVRLLGLQPASFERSAWDLAFVTQSLAHIDPQLVFSLSRIYTLQQAYGDLSRGILQAMYVRTPDENLPGFFSAVAIYYGDIVLLEPKLLQLYDEVRPRIDRALGEESPERPR